MHSQCTYYEIYPLWQDWYDEDGELTIVDGRDIVLGFKLQLWKIDGAGRFITGIFVGDNEEIASSKCLQTFEHLHLIERLEDECP